jgi:hypothetical protein
LKKEGNSHYIQTEKANGGKKDFFPVFSVFFQPHLQNEAASLNHLNNAAKGFRSFVGLRMMMKGSTVAFLPQCLQWGERETIFVGKMVM